MNLTMMMGRLVKDPDIRYTNSEDGPLAIANFRIAVERKFSKKDKDNNQENADFFNCTAFRRHAEFAEKYLFQGIKVIVSGEMRNNNYTNRNGEKVYGVYLRIDDIEFAESKAASQRQGKSDEPGEDKKGEDSDSGSNQKSNRRKADERMPAHSSSNRPRERRQSEGRKNESSGNKERYHKDNLDEEFRDMEEYEEEYAFN